MEAYVPGRARLASAGARGTVAEVLRNQPRGDVIRNIVFATILLAAIVLALVGLAALLIQAFAKGSSALSLDLLKNPRLAKDDQIVAIPTLVRKLPEPLRRIVGDLSDTERTLVGLQLRERK